MVQQALGQNRWLSTEGARIVQQGSFTNRTNTRLDADIDLRVQHPSIKIEYAPGVDMATAYNKAATTAPACLSVMYLTVCERKSGAT